MKLYLGGPMRGYPRYNFDAFLAAGAHLTALGHEVANPAQHDLDIGFDPDGPLDGFDLHASMTWDLDQVLRAEGIVLLDGWRASTGARLEYEVARSAGKSLSHYVADEDDPLWPLPDIPVAEIPTRDENVLQEAERLIYGDRNAAYGHPRDDFAKTAALWSALLTARQGEPVSVVPEDVPLMMILLKVSRELHRPKRDNIVDIAGYAGTLAMLHDG